MVHYLASISTSLIKTCLARTSLSVGADNGGAVEPEALLSVAEGFLETLQTHGQELFGNLRSRLTPVRALYRSADAMTGLAEPEDVIAGLDGLVLSAGEGDVILRGKRFDLSDLEVTALRTSNDVVENHVLLGGLHSIRQKLINLREMLTNRPHYPSGVPVGYESFSRLMLSLTSTGMIQRCEAAIAVVEPFILRMEREFGVTYRGSIAPVMTPYVRASRVYRSLYAQLHDWYAMG